MIIIQWVFFLLSSVLWISILRKSKLVFLPVFPFILGLLCGVDYMSSLFLFMNLSLMIVAVVKTIKNNHKPLPILLFFIGLMIVLFMTKSLTSTILSILGNSGSSHIGIALPFNNTVVISNSCMSIYISFDTTYCPVKSLYTCK